MRKRILSMLLAVCLLLTLMPSLAFADTLATEGTWVDDDGNTITLTDGLFTVDGGGGSFSNSWMGHFDKSVIKKAVVSNVSQVNSHAFAESTALESVVFSDGIYTFMNGIFEACESLHTIYLSNTASFLDDGCFSAIGEPIDLYYEGPEEQLAAIWSNFDYSITLHCSHYHSYTATTEGDHKLYACVCGVSFLAGYTSGTWTDADGNVFTLTDGVLTVNGAGGTCGDSWQNHYDKDAVKELVISNVKTIGSFAFSMCPLKSVSLPDTLETIDTCGFYNCSALESIALPGSLRYIGEQAFSFCDALKGIVIPDSVSVISMASFQDCTALRRVYIGSGVSEIGICVFNGSTGDIDAYYTGTEAELKAKFSGSYDWGSNITVHYEHPHDYNAITEGDHKLYICECGVSYTGSYTGGTWTDIYGNVFTLADGVLTVDGVGGRCDYYWSNHFDESAVKALVVKNVNIIGANAFRGCTALESVSLSEGLTQIEQQAFINCTALKGIVIPDSVNLIWPEVFSGCTALGKMYIGSGVSLIYSSSFNGITGDAYVYYTGSESELKSKFSPDYSLGSNFILYCKHGHYTIGDTLTYGDNYVRRTCQCGQSYVLYFSGTWTDENGNVFTLTDDGVLTVDGAGGACGDSWQSYFLKDNVKKAVIKNVTSLSGTFYFCRALEKVELPGDLKEIGNNTFYADEALKQIELPGGLESIGKEAFHGTGLTSITVPDSVKTLGERVFSNCHSLESAVLGSGCEDIPKGAFRECDKLSSVILPEGIKTIGDYAFASAPIVRIKLPESLTSIGIRPFDSIRVLKSISIPSNVQRLTENAFTGSYLGIEKIYISTGTTRIDSESFGTDTPYIKDVYYGGTEAEFYQAMMNGNGSSENDRLLNATMHYNHVHSYDYATEVIEPTCISKGYTVHECECGDYYTDSYVTDDTAHRTSIVGAVAPSDTDPGYTGDEVCSLCGATVAYGGSASGSFTSNGVTYTLNNGVLTVSGSGKTGMLWQQQLGATGVKEIVIEDGITELDLASFSECHQLTKVTIPGSVTKIGNRAFQGCTALESVSIPDSVTYIDSNAFANTGLKSVDIPDSVTVLGSNAFQNCKKLESITIGSGVKSLNGYTFQNCTSLKSVTIPDGVTAIGTSEFQGCTALESVSIPGSVTTIRSAAFYGCSSLKQLNLPEKLTGIEPYMFNYCTSLETVYIPGGVTEIGAIAFNHCDSLSTIYFGGTQEQWDAIIVGNSNESLKNARVIFEHTHSYTDVVTEHTCTSKGYTTHTCTCGYSYVDSYVDPHDLVLVGQMDASCTTDGYTGNYVCKTCSDMVTQGTVIPATGHDPKLVGEKAATCTEDGYTGDEVCKTCGATVTQGKAIPATGHDPELKNEKAATCTENGYTGDEVCKTCTTTVTQGKVIPATGHTYTDVVTKPTCTEQGYTTHTCKCGDVVVDTYVKALGHDTKLVGEKAATCTENGYTGDEVCKTCTKTVTQGKVIPATGHSYTDVVTKPTCTEQGYTTHTCACGDVVVDTYVKALGHSTELKNEKAATCTEDGYTGDEVCKTCTATVTQGKVIPATGHTYTDVVTKPTCTEQGYTTHTCACGDVVVDTYVKALGHDTELVGEKAATCTENGYTGDEVCKTCTATVTQGKVIPATGHSYTDVVTAPTCTEQGYTTHTCACGDVVVDTYVKALGHDTELKNEKAATCTEDGYTGDEVCKTCTATVTQGKVIPATGHSYTDVVTKPTCTEQGYTTHTCACGDVVVDTYVKALGHDTELKNEKAATCTEDGYTGDEVCKTCTETVTKGKLIPATGHTYTDVVTAPTCTEQGYTTHTCACGDVVVDTYVKALGHDTELVGEKAATCTEDGYTGDEVCKTCTATVTKGKVIPATGHSYTDVITAPTCTEQGYTTHTCKCGDVVVDTYVKALGHDTKLVGEKAATCTEDGYTGDEVCKTCTATVTKGKVIPATGHSYTDVITAPTCTEQGYTTHTCKCGDVVVDTYVKALGHDTKLVGEKAATCTEDGYTGDEVCKTCTATVTQGKVIPATGHSYTDVVTKPTCTEQGYTTHTCACGDVVVDTYVNALGHDTKLVGEKAATCTEDGYTGDEVCKTCTATVTKGKVIPATGHSYTDVVTKPTCTEQGYTTHTCACGDVVVDTYVKALGHDTELKNEKAATCTEDGYTGDEICKTCTATVTQGKVIPATGHSYTDVVTAPTCTEQGYTTHTCACGDVVVDTYVKALGHDTELKNEKAATCTEDGYTGDEVCKTCTATVTKGKVIPATGHSYTDVVTAPTCTEQGYTTHTCACGDVVVDTYVKALGHDTELKNEKAATCTENGYTGDEVCKTCTETVTKGKLIPATGHDTKLINQKDATCTEAGYTGDEVCKTCGETVKTGVETASRGHDYVNGVCARCGDSKLIVNPFVDVFEDNYYYSAVLWAYYHEPQISGGVDETHFDPMSICTRAQIVTFLWRAHGCPEPAGTATAFNDVDEGDYYYKAVLWATEKGITVGYNDGGFHPDELATRAHAMTFFWRSLGCPTAPEGTVNTFADVPEDAYYHDAVLWAVANGVANGYESTLFGAADGCTRAQIVTFIYRYMA